MGSWLQFAHRIVCIGELVTSGVSRAVFSGGTVNFTEAGDWSHPPELPRAPDGVRLASAPEPR